MRPRPVLVAALVVLASGCVAVPPETDGTTAPDDAAGAWTLPFPDPMGQDHDHADPALHAHAWRFEQTAHHPLAGSPTHSSGAHALDVKAGWLFAAVYGGEADAEGGFFVFDLADPAAPRETGRYRFAGPMGGDRSIEATADADFVVLGTESIDCAGHVNPFGPGLYLVDVRDKSDPVVAHYVPDRGIHTVTVARIAGDDYVFTVTGGDNVFKIVREPVPRLERVGALRIGHDAVVVDDPLLQRPILFAANGNAGFEVWDVSDPTDPQNIAGWNIPDRGDRYYVHTGPVTFIDGKRIAVVSSEDWEDYPSPLWVLDLTDLGDVKVLAQWSNPGGHGAEGLRYSLHNPRFHGETLLVSHYHGGLWALDVGGLVRGESAVPSVVGQFMPAESTGYVPEPAKTHAVANELCGEFHMADAPHVFDVVSGDGVAYVADLHTGLYTVRPLWA